MQKTWLYLFVLMWMASASAARIQVGDFVRYEGYKRSLGGTLPVSMDFEVVAQDPNQPERFQIRKRWTLMNQPEQTEFYWLTREEVPDGQLIFSECEQRRGQVSSVTTGLGSKEGCLLREGESLQMEMFWYAEVPITGLIKASALLRADRDYSEITLMDLGWGPQN